MHLPESLPAKKRLLLEKAVTLLSHIPQMCAVVLGGSHASGTQQRTSDLDIGLYYLETQPFPLETIRQVAEELSRRDEKPTVTGFYEWGAWVNGGAWIQTESGKVDFLYRNLDQVLKTIQEAQEGICLHDYDQQPTHGFYSVGYLAETQICIPLYDPDGRIAELKKQVEGYPPLLKQAIITNALWAAEFTLSHAHGFAKKADIYNTAGCLTRAAANLTQVLFALNERYFLGDKGVTQTLGSFKILPDGYIQTILSVLAHPGKTRRALEQSVVKIEAAWGSVAARAGGRYKPKY